jgi:hypothetical protein
MIGGKTCSHFRAFTRNVTDGINLKSNMSSGFLDMARPGILLSQKPGTKLYRSKKIKIPRKMSGICPLLKLAPLRGRRRYHPERSEESLAGYNADTLLRFYVTECTQPTTY